LSGGIDQIGQHKIKDTLPGKIDHERIGISVQQSRN